MNSLFQRFARLLLVLILVSFLIALSVGFGFWLGRTISARTNVRSMGPTVTQLEQIGELTSTRVHVTDVLGAEGEGYRGSWLINGDALLSCDVSTAKIVHFDAEARTATIKLPPLHVISARVDHGRTKNWSVEKTTWLPWRWGDQGIMRDAAMFHAQQLVETAAGSERHLGPAKAQAELLIRQIYDFVEWKVTVEWD